jgi:hypothetical protein
MDGSSDRGSQGLSRFFRKCSDRHVPVVRPYHDGEHDFDTARRKPVLERSELPPLHFC